MQNDKEKLVNLDFPNVFKPTREKLVQAVEVIYSVSNEHVHELRKGNVINKFFAACIEIGVSNLKAIVQLGEPYFNEVANIMRNLNEACVDFFWLASINDSNNEMGIKIAQNFFKFQSYRFLSEYDRLYKMHQKDIFFKDMKNPYDDSNRVEQAKEKCSGYTPDDFKNWRYDKSIFKNKTEVFWENRCKIAAAFAEKAINLKDAPYHKNLDILSAFSHFDPAQLQEYMPDYRERIFDRNLNLAIGLVFDIISNSYKSKNWNRPDNFVILQNNNFGWYST